MNTSRRLADPRVVHIAETSISDDRVESVNRRFLLDDRTGEDGAGDSEREERKSLGPHHQRLAKLERSDPCI